jgi:hypothetical protein
VSYEVIPIEGDGEPPFPLWKVQDSVTKVTISDGVYAPERAVNARVERENA